MILRDFVVMRAWEWGIGYSILLLKVKLVHALWKAFW